ncbi:ABC transporter permease [Pseudomonas panipatensis]|uniref:ABC-2 type transport system permease protein n=1 Tax=Pseudomonas panipatensis TaxID=428992 RepID=A0A1G8E2U9_9PSED|nr:ABC transporter permease [Pseudomonas panipatensis]SDH63969.1 ABC-2 type transport system permease protein [Pseudomonas panipatensis]SMP38824.1 ABC-2 type transport system permease protein [Pseudomonas panipatensis]
MALAAVRRNLQRFAQAFNTETRLAVRSWTIHWLGWLWPLLLFTLISGIYQAGTLLDMPVAVVDADHSSLSRRVVRELDAGSHAQVEVLGGGLQEGLQRLRRAADYALLYIPRDFEADALAGRQPKAELYYNSLFYSAGYYSTQDFGGLVSALNQDLRPRLAAGMGQPLPSLASISVAYESLFNASGNYIYYQQFAAIVHLLQLFVIVATVHVLAREAPELRASSPHILRAKALGVRLLGKLAPYTLMFSTLLMVELFLLVTLNGAKINGSVLWMLAITLCYVAAAQSLGLILFIFTANRFSAYSLIGLLIGVAQTYSGVLLPDLAMPEIARLIAIAEPLTHTLHGLFDQFLRQAPAESGLYACAKLLLYPLVAYLIAKQRLRRRLDLSPA